MPLKAPHRKLLLTPLRSSIISDMGEQGGGVAEIVRRKLVEAKVTDQVANLITEAMRGGVGPADAAAHSPDSAPSRARADEEFTRDNLTNLFIVVKLTFAYHWLCALQKQAGRRVRVRLSASQYEAAIEAHRIGDVLEVTGEQSRVGNLYWLYNVRDIHLVQRQLNLDDGPGN